MGDIISLQESYHIFLVFAYICPKLFFLPHKHAKKKFYKEFTLQGLSVVILLVNKVSCTWKTNISITLNDIFLILIK